MKNKTKVLKIIGVLFLLLVVILTSNSCSFLDFETIGGDKIDGKGKQNQSTTSPSGKNDSQSTTIKTTATTTTSAREEVVSSSDAVEKLGYFLQSDDNYKQTFSYNTSLSDGGTNLKESGNYTIMSYGKDKYVKFEEKYEERGDGYTSITYTVYELWYSNNTCYITSDSYNSINGDKFRNELGDYTTNGVIKNVSFETLSNSFFLSSLLSAFRYIPSNYQGMLNDNNCVIKLSDNTYSYQFDSEGDAKKAVNSTYSYFRPILGSVSSMDSVSVSGSFKENDNLGFNFSGSSTMSNARVSGSYQYIKNDSPISLPGAAGSAREYTSNYTSWLSELFNYFDF